MQSSLSDDGVERYWLDGFVKPIDVLSLDEVAALRCEIEAAEATYSEGSLPRPINQYFRVNGQVVLPFLSRVARHPNILDAVEAILGPDLLLWSCELFIKEAKSSSLVSWHQDQTYWGMGGTDRQLTAWIAISDVTEQAGCMRFVPGSHQFTLQPHHDSFADNNLLSRGQEIAVDVDEKDAVLDILKPGQMSLHHGRMFHSSGPNNSSDRRIGVAIRYITPEVRQQVGERDYAMLVRGADRTSNWINVAPPDRAFGEGSMRLYEEILLDQSAALTQGAGDEVGLYASAG